MLKIDVSIKYGRAADCQGGWKRTCLTRSYIQCCQLDTRTCTVVNTFHTGACSCRLSRVGVRKNDHLFPLTPLPID